MRNGEYYLTVVSRWGRALKSAAAYCNQRVWPRSAQRHLGFAPFLKAADPMRTHKSRKSASMLES